MNRESITSQEFKDRLLFTDSLVRTGKIRYENKAILIEHLDVEGEVNIDALKLDGRSVILTDVQFNGPFRCNHGQMERVHFIDCRFDLLGFIGSNVPATVQNCEIETLVLESSRASAELLVHCVAKHVKLYQTQLSAHQAAALRPQETLTLNACHLNSVFLRQHSEDHGHRLKLLDINHCQSGDLNLLGLRVDLLRIRDMLFVQSYLRLESCEVSHLHIEDLEVRESNVVFKSIKIVPRKGSLVTDDLRLDDSASVRFTGLRTPELAWSFCDWSRIKMYVADNLISSVITKGSTTPRQIVPLKDGWKEVADLYGLFESHARAQGHTADAITNRSGGLRAYRIYLDKRKRDRMDRFTLWLSESISDYGSNWVRALGVLIGTGFTLFLLLVLGFDDRVVIGIDSTTGEVILKYAGYYLDFLSPIHAKDFMEIELTGWAKVIDALSRICVGFVIYHLIRSTRKFVS